VWYSSPGEAILWNLPLKHAVPDNGTLDSR
jgi:hypothetical protein